MPDLPIDIEEPIASVNPNIALLFYGNQGIATVHSIRSGALGAELSPGRLLANADLHGLAAIFGRRSTEIAHVLPERVLGCGPNFLTWYCPGKRRAMHCRVRSVTETLDVVWPNLIFHARDRVLFAAAYTGSSRPGPSTRVYMPPLMNFYDHTSMCRGSAHYPDDHSPDSIGVWEAAVFESAFTHINGSGKIKGRADTTDAHMAFWKHPARRTHGVTERHLMPLPWATTCEEWLDSVRPEAE